MVVLPSNCDGHGVVIAVAADYAVLAMQSGELMALRWGDMSIDFVLPDPEYLSTSRRAKGGC